MRKKNEDEMDEDVCWSADVLELIQNGLCLLLEENVEFSIESVDFGGYKS